MIHTRTDHAITTADGIATEYDIRSLHDVVGDATSDGITVAVMDSGIDTSHSVFDDVEVEEHDFTGSGNGDQIGHGTATAGLIAQLAPDVEIIALRIFGDSGRTGLKPIKKAYQYLFENADRIDVCNLSWGAMRNTPTINELHTKLIESGIQDVVSAGNTGFTSGSPATCEGAFSVGAVDESGDLTRFSSFNPRYDNPDVCAIGKNVKLARASGTSMGTVIDEQWVKASGTSFSAPIVSGLTALYQSIGGTEARVDFQYTARDIRGTSIDGEGIVDYDDALSEALRETPPSPPTKPESSLLTWLKMLIRWLL